MTAFGASIITKASDEAVFSVLADELNAARTEDRKLVGVRVSVNASRFGADEAFSVRLKTRQGEAEIGKLVVVSLGQDRYELKIPVNHTGGSALPQLDPDGSQFETIVAGVLKRLAQRDLLPLEPPKKRPIGFKAERREV